MSERYSDRDKTEMALRLMEAMSGADEELLLRSESRPRNYRTYGRAVAACLALAVVGVLSWNGLKMVRTAEDYHNSLAGGAGDDSIQLTAEAVNADTGMAMDKAGIAEVDIEDHSATVRGEEGAFFQEEEDGIADLDDSPEKSMLLESEVQMEDRMLSDKMESSTNSGGTRKELSEQEARNTEVLGDYIPEIIPAGYAFENAWSIDGGLTVTWTRGMDDIMISLSIVVPESVMTVDIGATETYDVDLYEIPYGENVPEQYREIFQDPVFAAADMSLEVVSRRMKSIEDAGDTNTPRGSFTVLYPDGVVLRFNGRGTAEEIWNMINSLEGE